MSTVTIPTVTMTQTAREQILAAMNMEGRTAHGLRLTVKQAGTSTQQYGLSLVEKATPDVNDVVVEVDGIKVFLERNNTRFLDGATIDYLAGPNGSGFKIESPFKPPTLPGFAGEPPTGPLAEAVQKVKDDVAYIQLGGGCQGCGMADVTLKQGIVVMIKKAVPAIKDVLDVTDHAGGANPYYQPSSK